MSEYVHTARGCNGAVNLSRGDFHCSKCHAIVPKDEVLPRQVVMAHTRARHAQPDDNAMVE